VIRLTILSTLATIGAGFVLALDVFDPATVVAVYVLVLGALALLALTRIAQTGNQDEPSLFDLSLRRPPEHGVRPPELVRVERELVLGMESAGQLHVRLVPLLREAAAVRLSANHHVDLERRPDLARRLLGDEVWELLRPDRPEPTDKSAPGISRAKLGGVVDVLESI